MANDDFEIVQQARAPEPPPKVVKAEKTEKSPVIVGVDTTFDDIVRYDKTGTLVRFANEPGKFKRLSDEQIDQLSWLTRGAYLDAERAHKRALEEAEHPELFTKNPVFQADAMATTRLDVRNKKPGMHYVWKRPDEFQQATVYEGYQTVQDENVATFVRGPSSVRTVGTQGNPELVLLQIPEAEFQKRLKQNEQLSRQRVVGAQASGASEIARAGGKVYDPDANPQADGRLEWHDRKPGDT